MSSQIILGKRGRDRIKQLQFDSAREQFMALLPKDTSQEVLDGLATELPLHFWALSLITRGDRKVQSFAKQIYAISEQFYEKNENIEKPSEQLYEARTSTETSTSTTNYKNIEKPNGNINNKIDEMDNKGDREHGSALQSLKNIKLLGLKCPPLFPSSESDSD